MQFMRTAMELAERGQFTVALGDNGDGVVGGGRQGLGAYAYAYAYVYAR